MKALLKSCCWGWLIFKRPRKLHLVLTELSLVGFSILCLNNYCVVLPTCCIFTNFLICKFLFPAEVSKVESYLEIWIYYSYWGFHSVFQGPHGLCANEKSEYVRLVRKWASLEEENSFMCALACKHAFHFEYFIYITGLDSSVHIQKTSYLWALVYISSVCSIFKAILCLKDSSRLVWNEYFWSTINFVLSS